MLKTKLFTNFAETVFFSGFFDAFKVKKITIYLKDIFFVTMQVFTATFDQFPAFLLIFFLKRFENH